jgi:hypothetical protein
MLYLQTVVTKQIITKTLLSPFLDPAFADAIPHQQKQGLLKTLLNTVGIKTQDTTMPTTAPTTNFDSYSPPPPSNIGMASGLHYSTPNRDIQNRKAL